MSRATALAPPSLGHASMVTARDGVGLFTTDWGEGRPMVFLAGLGLPSDMWDYQRLALSNQGYRCVAYDRRGHGRSTIPGAGYDFDTLADDLAAVLDALDLKDVILVGHSMASGEMVRYLSRHGDDRVAGLVFLSSAATPSAVASVHNPDAPTAEQFRAYVDGVITRDFPAWMAENAEPFFTPETPAATRQWIMQLMLATSLKAIHGCNHAQAASDFGDELAAIRRPALVIHGDRDASAPVERGRRTAALIPGAVFKLYEGAPHGAFLTHRERLNTDLLEFAADG